MNYNVCMQVKHYNILQVIFAMRQKQSHERWDVALLTRALQAAKILLATAVTWYTLARLRPRTLPCHH